MPELLSCWEQYNYATRIEETGIMYIVSRGTSSEIELDVESIIMIVHI